MTLSTYLQTNLVKELGLERQSFKLDTERSSFTSGFIAELNSVRAAETTYDLNLAKAEICCKRLQ